MAVTNRDIEQANTGNAFADAQALYRYTDISGSTRLRIFEAFHRNDNDFSALIDEVDLTGYGGYAASKHLLWITDPPSGGL